MWHQRCLSASSKCNSWRRVHGVLESLLQRVFGMGQNPCFAGTNTSEGFTSTATSGFSCWRSPQKPGPLMTCKIMGACCQSIHHTLGPFFRLWSCVRSLRLAPFRRLVRAGPRSGDGCRSVSGGWQFVDEICRNLLFLSSSCLSLGTCRCLGMHSTHSSALAVQFVLDRGGVSGARLGTILN